MKLATFIGTTLAAGLVLAGTATRASATVYTSQGVFSAANPGLAQVSFTGLTSLYLQIDSPYTQDGITFYAPNLYAVSTNFFGSVDSLYDNTFQGSIKMAFAPAAAIGFFVAGNEHAGTPVDITVYDPAFNVVFSGSPVAGGFNDAFTFWGIDGIGAIGAIEVSSLAYPGGSVAIGEIQYGNSAAVPEPANWALMVSGLGLVGFATRRRAAVVVA